MREVVAGVNGVLTGAEMYVVENATIGVNENDDAET